MKKYSEFPVFKPKMKLNPKTKFKPNTWKLLAIILSAHLPDTPAHAEEPAACVLTSVAGTTLQMAERGMEMVLQLESAIDRRVAESKDAFKDCEQNEACRSSDRLHVLENAFNQAHEQKQRVAKAHAEASQSKAELEERYKALKQQAVGCTPSSEQQK